MILFFLSRYLPAYLFIMLIAVCVFVGLTMLINGLLIAVLGWLALLLTGVLAIPYLVVRDALLVRKEVAEHVHLIKSHKFSGNDTVQYQAKIVEMISKRTGLPKRLVNQAVCRALNQ